ncbi:MAG: universal stress protein [Nitrospirota bacterium]
MYNTIVVAYDNSEFSRAALLESSEWIKKHSGRVILVHAVYFDEEEFSIAPVQLDKRLEEGKKICLQAKNDFSNELGIEVESLVCEGDAPDVIKQIAREKNADLIAMGTHGRKGLKRLIMGSVTAGVIADSPCDVLVVKRPCHECSGTYRNILLPFDGSEFSGKALLRAHSLSKADGGSITALYVIPRYEEMIGFMKTESIKKSLFSEAERILRIAKEGISENGVQIRTEIEEGQAGDKIVETAGRINSDLIVMGSYGWTGVNKAIIGSTTERVIMNASCPILVVR